MSGQFQQRRLARPAFQLNVLDAFAGNEDARVGMRAAWRELVAALRRYAAARRARSAERALLALDERTLRDIGVESWQPGLGQRLQEYRRRDALRLRATLLGQL
jgi:DNA repair ATPase RecN